MHAREIGRTGLVARPIGLGSRALAGGYGPVDRRTAFGTVSAALDLGNLLIDLTAPPRDRPRVQRLVGRAIAGRRDEVVLSAPVDPGSIARSCGLTLRRLRVDHLDLVHLSRRHPGQPVEEDMAQLAKLVTAGTVRHVGLCGVSAAELAAAHAVHPVAAAVVEYSLWCRDAELELLPAARRLGVGIIACRPLGRGFLAGRITSPDQLAAADDRRRDHRFSRTSLDSQLRALVPTAEQLAAELHVGLPRLALAWLLAQGDDVVAVPGTRSPVHLEMNAAASAVRLPPGVSDRLAALFPPRPDGHR